MEKPAVKLLLKHHTAQVMRLRYTEIFEHKLVTKFPHRKRNASGVTIKVERHS